MKKFIRFITLTSIMMGLLIISLSNNAFGQLTVKILYNSVEVDPINGCQGTTTIVNSEVTGGSGDYTYTWNCAPVNPFFVPSDDAAFFLAASSSGTFTVSLNVLDNISGFTGSKNITVIINPRPLATIVANGPTTFCQGGSVELEETNGQAAVDYKWLKGGVEISGATSNKYSATQSGFYIAKVIYSSTGCFKNSNQITVTVNPNATISLTSAAGTDAQTKCINSSIDNITYAVGGGGTGASVTGLPAGVTGSFAGGTFTISGTPTASGTFNYTVTTSGTCTQTTANGSITVTPDATITLTSAVGTTNQTKCINTPITNITYAIGGSGTGANVIGLPAGVSGSYSAGVFTISGTPTVSGTFNYTVTTTGPCVQATANGTLNINPNSTISITSAVGTDNQTKCINTPIDNITYAVGGSGTGASVAGLPAGVSGSFAGGVYTISGTPTASGTFNYTVTTTGPCVQATATGTIIVTPDATITRTSAVGTDAQVKCINTAITNITYTVGGSGTNATVLGLPAGVNGVFAAGVFTISGTPTVSGLFNYTVTATGPCASAIANGTINVNANSTIALTSAAGTDAQVICVNTPIVNITYAVGGSGTGASVSGLPAGVSGSFAGGVYTISGTPTASGTFNYTVTTTGPCVQATATGSITVTPNATINRTSAAGTDAQVLCINTPLTNITYSIGVGGTGANVSGLPAGVNGSYAGGVFTISGSPTASGTFNYTVTTTGPCIQATANGTITVTPNATINRTSAVGTDAQVVCINTPIVNITYAVGGSGTGATVSGLPAGVTGAFAAGTFTISGTPTVSGPFNYTVTTTGPCAQATANGSINVTSNATISLSSAAGTNAQTVCINAPIINITYSIGGGGTGATVSGLPAGVTGSFAGGTFTISGTPTVSGPFNYTVTTTGSCVQTSANGTITVNPNSTISRTSAVGTDAQSLCVNTLLTNITYAVGGSGTGATVSGLPAGVSGSYAGGVFTISGTPTASGTFNYTVTTTGPCTQATANGVITVNPNATITRTSAAATTNQTVCINNPVVNITYSIGGGGTGAGVVGLPAGVSGSFAAGIFTISGTPTASGVFNYTVTTTGTCVQATAAGTITVNANSTITLTSAAGTNAQSVCINSPIINITYSIGGSGTGATVSGLPSGITGTFATGVFTISGTPTANGTFNYTVTTTGPCVQATANGSIVVNSLPSVTFAGTLATQCITSTTYALTGGLPVGGTYSGPGVTGTNFNASVAGAGTHTIAYMYNDVNGCSGSATNTITVNPAIGNNTISSTKTSICYNSIPVVFTGTTPTGGSGTYTYQWESSIAGAGGPFAIIAGETSKDYTPTTPITVNTWYRRVVTSAPCSALNSNVIQITVGPVFTATTTTTSPKCVGSSDGTATAVPVGGTPAPGGIYTYSWNTTPIQSTKTATGLVVGIYIVTVTDNIGCTTTATATITDPTPVTLGAPTVTDVTGCFGNSNGAIQIQASGGTAPYTYTLTNNGVFVKSVGPTGTPANFTLLVAGTLYQVSAEDANGCNSAISANITVNQPALLAFTYNLVNLSCNGSANGEIHFTPSGGTPPYQYSILGGSVGSWKLSPDFTGLTAGTYLLKVKDANNCTTASTSVKLTQPAAIVTDGGTWKDVLGCFGDPTGSISVKVTGGTPPFTFSINGGTTWQATGDFLNLFAGTYTVIVKDGNGCTTNIGPNTINQPAKINITAELVDDVTICWNNKNGSIIVLATGGTGDLKFSIDGGTTWQDDGFFSGLGTGTYQVAVKDANDCQQMGSLLTVLGPTPITLTAPPTIVDLSCNGVIPADGEIHVVATGGTGVLTYSIDGTTYQATGDFTGLTAGDYTLRVKDANNCVFTQPITVNEPPAIVFTSPTSKDITCFGLVNGEIHAAATGGTGALTYTLLPAGVVTNATGDFLGLSAGTYSVRVTDTKGCFNTTTNFTIIEPALFTFVSATFTTIDCNGDNSTITLVANGGTDPKSYTITDGGAFTQTNATGIFNNIPAGNYTYTIKDANNCNTFTGPLNITQPAPIVISTPVITQMTGPSANDGKIKLNATGGTGLLTFTLNPGGVLLTAASGVDIEFTSLAAGTYTIDVTDVNGCTASVGNLRIGLLDLTLTPTDITCNGLNNGQIALTINSGTAPYTITWTGPSGALPAFNDMLTITGLSAGLYTVNVTDAIGVTGTASVTINEPAVFAATWVSTQDKLCFGDANGSVTFNITGGTAPYTIAWTEGTTPRTEVVNVAPYVATNVAPGIYNFTITDAGNCGNVVINAITLADPQKLNITNIVGLGPNCNGEVNGSITVTAVGGTAPLNYTITGPVSTSVTDGIFNNLLSGDYTVALTDANGCVASSDVSLAVTLTEPPALQVSSTLSPRLACPNVAIGYIKLHVTGGTSPYTYDWSNGQTEDSLANVIVGEYSVLITDAHGCTITRTDSVRGPKMFMITGVKTTDAICSGYRDKDDIGRIEILSETGGTPTYSYHWNHPKNGAITGRIIDKLSAGDYAVTINDANNCTYYDTISIGSDPDFYMRAEAYKDTTLCGSTNLSLIAFEHGNNVSRKYFYSWYEIPNTSGTPLSVNKIFDVSPTRTTKYYLEVRNDSLCFSSDTAYIDIYPKVNMIVPPYISSLQQNNDPAKKDTIIAILSGSTYNLDVIPQNTEYATTFKWEPEILFNPADSWNSSIYTDKVIYAQIPANRIVTLTDPQTKSKTKFILIDVKALTEKGCKDSLRLYAKIINNVAFGNVFSPNGDGLNDKWEVPRDYLFPDLSIEIFDRWGARVWSASGDKAARGWDGRTDNGKELPIGTYYYVVKFNANTSDKKWEPVTGSVTIVR